MQNIGYARISTEEQSLNLQLDALRKAGCAKIYKDIGVSGAAQKRKGLQQALKVISEGDTLVVWRLDRLGRSLPHLISTVAELSERGVHFNSLTEAIDTTSPGGTLIFHMMGALAQFERTLIVERTQAGLVAAKKRGVKLGRPSKLTREQLIHAKQMIDSGEKTQAAMARVYGVNRATLWRALKNESRAINLR